MLRHLSYVMSVNCIFLYYLSPQMYKNVVFPFFFLNTIWHIISLVCTWLDILVYWSNFFDKVLIVVLIVEMLNRMLMLFFKPATYMEMQYNVCDLQQKAEFSVNNKIHHTKLIYLYDTFMVFFVICELGRTSMFFIWIPLFLTKEKSIKVKWHWECVNRDIIFRFGWTIP